MFIEKSWIHISIGYDHRRLIDMGVFIGLFPIKGKFFYDYFWSFNAGWDWMPTIQRMSYYSSNPRVIDSSRWTGRRYYFHDWNWPFYLKIRFLEKE